MAIESLVGLAFVTAFLAGLAWYAFTHRSEDAKQPRRRRDRAGTDQKQRERAIEANSPFPLYSL